jgi:hypothetical protein
MDMTPLPVAINPDCRGTPVRSVSIGRAASHVAAEIKTSQPRVAVLRFQCLAIKLLATNFSARARR